MGEATSWTDHVLNGKSWRRFGFMLLFAPLLGCVGFMIAFVALFQFFSVLASGENNSQLRSLGRDLSRFAVVIMDYLTYNTDRKPFPFGPRPSESDLAAGHDEAGASREPARPARRTTAGRRQRKTRARKTTVRRRSTTTGSKPRHPAPSETDKPSDETDGGEEGDRHE